MRLLMAFLAAGAFVLLLLWAAAMLVQPPAPATGTSTDTTVPFTD